MKKFFYFLSITLLFLAVLFAVSACGEQKAKVGALELRLNEDRSGYKVTLAIDPEAESIIIPSSHNDLPIVEISDSAFRGCTKLKKVVIPSSVKIIRSYAFEECSALEEVLIPSSVESIGSGAFYSCSALGKISLPSSIKNIAESAFSGCTSLAEVTIPSSVETIGYRSFAECTSLKKLTLKDGIKTIGPGAFSGCKSLEEVVIPDSVTALEADAFSHCENLKNIVIGKGLSAINDYAFSYCLSLKNIDIPDGIVRIEKGAFNNTGLTKITLGTGLKSIGKEAFSYAPNEKIYYAGDIASWFNITFEDGQSIFTDDTEFYFKNESGEYELLTTLVIPEGVENIGSTFSGYSKLISITIPGSVKTVSYKAFENCTNLLSVTIEDGVTSIGAETFAGCEKLVEITNNSSLSESECKAGAPNVLDVHSGNGKLDIRDGMAFYFVDDKNYLVSYTGSKQIVALPESYDGNDYVIADNAFKDNCKILSVTIPESAKIESVSSSAFDGCYRLVEVINNSSLEFPSIVSSVRVKRWLIEEHQGSSKLETIGDFLFYPYNDNFYLVSYTGDENELVFPDSYKGRNYIIGDYVFCGNGDITSVKVPSGVSGMGECAFYECNSLEIVYVDNLVSWCAMKFDDWRANPFCSGARFYLKNASGEYEHISDLVIPKNIETIGDWVFSECSSLKSVVIGNDVITIGADAFRDCQNLSEVEILHGVKNIKSWAFARCETLTNIKIPDSIETISDSSFIHSQNIVDISVDENNKTFKSIDGSLFSKDETVLVRYATGKDEEEIVISSNIKTFRENAFYGADFKKVYYDGDIASWCKLNIEGYFATPVGNTVYMRNSSGEYEIVKSIIIPESITEIKDYTFWGFSGLEEIVLHDNIKSIGVYVFTTGYLSDLINRENGGWYIGNYLIDVRDAEGEFKIKDGTKVIAKGAFDYCGDITDIIIPDSVIAIDEETFYNLGTLKTVVIGNGVKTIGKYAFALCDNLTSVIMGNGVEVIENLAFTQDYKLENVILSSSLKTIGVQAFYECAISTITIPETVTTIAHSAFLNCENLEAIEFENPVGWKVSYTKYESSEKIYIPEEKLSDATIAAQYFSSSNSNESYAGYEWERN